MKIRQKIIAFLCSWRNFWRRFSDWSAEEKEHVAQELSDIVCYLVRLADKCQVDLPKAVVKKIAANAAKYPAQEVWGDSRKYNEYGSKSKTDSD